MLKEAIINLLVIFSSSFFFSTAIVVFTLDGFQYVFFYYLSCYYF